MIQLQTVSLQLGTKTLLEDANLAVFPGQTWGLVGANGSGKSTLFKLLLGQLQEDAGSVSLPAHWQIAHMAQEADGGNRIALEYVLDGDQPLRELQQKIDSGECEGEALAKLYQQMETIDGYSAAARAERLLNGLGFKSSDSLRPVSDFSGGWRIRLNLAQALMCRSDLLLLDEPTNHLDLDATLWLEQWLAKYPGTLLIISHDRDFLDNLVDNIAHLEHQKLNSYSGNYSAFETQRAERLAQQTAEFQKQQTRIAEIENFVRRFRAKATKAKQAQSRLKELERMEKIAPAHVDSPFSFSFPEPDKRPQTLLTLDDLAVGYGEPALVSKIELSILEGTRVGLLGHNGAGKSTLIKTMAGELPVMAGKRITAAHLKIGYFAQHQLEALDLQASCALHLQRLEPTASEQQIRNFLGGFGFQGDRAFENITHFSGGEKARLALAVLAWQKPNLLLLDEPTNHLDLEMRHALTLALQAWEGPLVMISHDRHLLRSTVDEFLLVDSGKVTHFEGSLPDYQRWLLDSGKNQDSEESPLQPAAKKDKKGLRQQQAAIRNQLAPFTKKINALEKKLNQLGEELARVETALADPELYTSNPDKLSSLIQEQGKLKKSLEDIELEWLDASDHKEQLEAELARELED